jgi:transcriptional regulator with XRE-family HTH domain
MEEVSDRFSAFLKAKKINQNEAAGILGVARQTISALVNGRQGLKTEYGNLLKEKYPALNLSWLFWGEGEMLENVATDANNHIYMVKRIEELEKIIEDLKLEKKQIMEEKIQLYQLLRKSHDSDKK